MHLVIWTVKIQAAHFCRAGNTKDRSVLNKTHITISIKEERNTRAEFLIRIHDNTVLAFCMDNLR